MYKRKRMGPLRTVAIWNSEVGRYSGGVMYSMNGKKIRVRGSVRYMGGSAIGGSTALHIMCVYKIMVV